MEMSNNTGLLMQSLGSLVLVLVVMVVVLYGVRWIMQRRVSGAKRLQLVESIALGNREKLLLVKADQRQLLLGVSQSSVQLVAELQPAELTTEQSPSVASLSVTKKGVSVNES